jgi:hypothetical protein
MCDTFLHFQDEINNVKKKNENENENDSLL